MSTVDFVHFSCRLTLIPSDLPPSDKYYHLACQDLTETAANRTIPASTTWTASSTPPDRPLCPVHEHSCSDTVNPRTTPACCIPARTPIISAKHSQSLTVSAIGTDTPVSLLPRTPSRSQFGLPLAAQWAQPPHTAHSLRIAVESIQSIPRGPWRN